MPIKTSGDVFLHGAGLRDSCCVCAAHLQGRIQADELEATFPLHNVATVDVMLCQQTRMHLCKSMGCVRKFLMDFCPVASVAPDLQYILYMILKF